MIPENYRQMHKLNQLKLKPGLAVFYAIRPGNGLRLLHTAMEHTWWALCVAVCWCDWQGGDEAWYCNAAGCINVCVLHSAVCVAGKSRPQQFPVPWCCKYMYEVYRQYLFSHRCCIITVIIFTSLQEDRLLPTNFCLSLVDYYFL